MRRHYGVSQFPIGHRTRPNDFVLRNRTMALLCDVSIIVEAGETSGSLHEGWEAVRLGRPLFIWSSLMKDSALSWPKKMGNTGQWNSTTRSKFSMSCRRPREPLK